MAVRFHSEMALDLSSEFRQFDSNKKSSEFSRKIVAENSAKKTCSLIHKELAKLAEMALDLSAEFQEV